MADVFFLDYEIHLRDEARVLELQTNPPGETSLMPNGKRGIIRAPFGAQIEFQGDNGGVPLPIINPGRDNIPSDGAYLLSMHFQSDDDDNYPKDAATFVRKSGGLFGVPLLFGTTKRFYWRGVFVYDAPLSDDDPSDPGTLRSPVMRRRWIDAGPLLGANREQTGVDCMTRDAGRWVDTVGWTIGGQNFDRQQRVKEHDPVAPGTENARATWERLYLRVMHAGDEMRVWRCDGGTTSHGAQMNVLATGQLAFYNIGGSTVLLGTTEALTPEVWYKVDICLSFADGGAGFGAYDYNAGGLGVYPGARLRVWLNNVEQLNVAPPVGSGLGSTGFHRLSAIGPSVGSNLSRVQIGFWMGAERPLFFNGLDFLNGSRPVPLRPESFDPVDHANWAGDWSLLSSVPYRAVNLVPITTEHLTSSTSGAKIAAITDAARALSVPGIGGVAGIVIHHVGYSGGGNGSIGYKIGANAEVLAAMGQFGTDGVYPEATGTQNFPLTARMMYRPSHSQSPILIEDLLPFQVRRVKAANGNASGTYSLFAVAEAIGIFGEEDYPSTFDEALKQPIPTRGPHNAPYPRTPWAYAEAPPIAPVVIKTGTYVGNGTQTVLSFPAPVNWMWIRRVPGTTNPGQVRWWSSMLGATLGGEKAPHGWLLPVAEMDPSIVGPILEDQASWGAVIRLGGAHAENNANGVTYAYTAVMDPGMRFLLNGAMSSADAGNPVTHNLIVPTFTPLAALLNEQRWGNFAAQEMLFKGPGHTATSITPLNAAAVIADGLSFGLGTITQRAGLGAETINNFAYALMRSDDGSGDPGVYRVFGVGSYVGNGVASRDIIHTVPGLSGRRPVFILVVANGGAVGHFRDCQHPTTNSMQLTNGALVTTAITGGLLNGFTVGTSANANGTTYHYMIIWGSETAANGGMSECGEFWPVPPDIPPCIRIPGVPTPPGCDPGDPEPPGGGDGGDDPDDDPPGNPGGGCDDIDSDLEVACLPHTSRLANLALQRIGHSTFLGSGCEGDETPTLETDTSEAAVNIRLALARVIETVLHDRPWPFATRYALLELLTGSVATPANRDWTYAYRRPVDCVFERRIVVVREGAPGGDVTPPPMRLSFDNTLAIGRIFTNQQNARLEYTARPECSAGVGDPLFFDALAWKLAEAIAPPLTRMVEKEKYCAEKYLECLMKFDEIINLGNPGPRQTLDPDGLDTGTGAQAANVAVLNRGLIRIGARPVANLGTEQSPEAEAARNVFEEELRSVLRDYPWAFATKYADALTLVRGPRSSDEVIVGAWSATVSYAAGDVVEDSGTTYYALQPALGAAQDPTNAAYWTETPVEQANDDWIYAWRTPAHLVAVRRLVTESRRMAEVDPEEFREGGDAQGGLIFSKRDNPTFEYTARIPSAVLRADPLFRDALAWRLAACLAPRLATIDPDVPEQLGRGQRTKPQERKPVDAQLRARAATYAWQQYYVALEKARVADARSQQQEEGPDAPWISGR